MLTREQRRDKIGDVFRVASGNFLEQYDFFVFAYYASYIGKTFFPSTDPFASLMLTFATFAAGFLMRPLGAFFLGSYLDRKGRRQGLIVTLAIMAVGTLTIALVPGYATLGVARADPHRAWAVAAGFLRRRRTRRRLRLSRRDRNARE